MQGGRGNDEMSRSWKDVEGRRGRSAPSASPSGSGARRGCEVTDPNLGEDALLLEGAGDERLELHHLPRVVVHGSPFLASLLFKRPPSFSFCTLGARRSSPATARGERDAKKNEEQQWGSSRLVV